MTAAAVTFIGDVHGWSARLRSVIAQAEGEIILLGDLIDRGPDAPGVIRQVRELVDADRARCVLGNHEYAMLCGLGHPSIGLPYNPRWFQAWRDRYGGRAVMAAYDAEDAAGLREAMGDDLAFVASLPWIERGTAGGRQWIAVHAGLAPDRPWREQVEELEQGWPKMVEAPAPIFEKPWSRLVPDDLPADITLVSGHTPLAEVWQTPQRILCDTSGGMPHRLLSGVIWPEGRVVTG